MENNMYHILQKLLIKNNIKLHQEELKLQLLSHPSYPSLHALTGVMNHFNVDNLAVKLPSTKEVLSQLPKYFIANVNHEETEQLVLVERKEKRVRLLISKKESKTISEDEFTSQWDGITVAIEKDDTIKETKKNPLSSVATWGLIVIGGILAGLFLFNTLDTFPMAHFILSILGLVLSIFIVQHELGIQSTASNQFCNLTENTSCDAILNSKGASIFGMFKLSDVSLVTFAGYLCCWFTLALSGATTASTIVVLTIAALPFTVYSIYYQGIIVKKWCPLCLGIVGILWLQVIPLFIAPETLTSLVFTTEEILMTTLTFFVVASVWSFVKTLLKKKETLAELEVEHYKFKRNFSLFHALYSEGKSLTNTQGVPDEIILGNRKAPLTLTLVTNPLCYYCKDAHQDIEQLLKQRPESIKVRIRFMVDPDQKESTLYKTISELLHVFNTNGQSATIELLNQLYADDADVNSWVEQQNIHYNPGYDKIMNAQNDWCSDNAINFTPALYLGDKPYPKEYDRKDLLFFIDDLIEKQQTIIAPIEQELKAS